MIIHKLFAPLPSLHPLFCVTLALMLGICWQSNICSIPLLCFLALSTMFIARFITYSTTMFYMLMIAIFISFFVGGFISYTQKQQFKEWINSFQEPVDIIATITDITLCSTQRYNYVVKAQIEKIRATDHSCLTQWQTTPYKLMVYTQIKPTACVQDRIFFSSIKISKPSHESWHRYALKHGIGGTLFCKKLTYNLISRPHWSPKRWLWTYRQEFYNRLLKKMSYLTATFYSLLFMGIHYKGKKNSESLRTTFQIWGILHYLARSGLHLVVFIMVWYTMLLAIPCSYRIREGILILLSCTYFLLTWPSLSFVRAFTTYILYKISGLCYRTSNTLHIITLVTLLFLVVNPIHLFCLDFQLSFGLTFALAWLQNNNYIWKNSYMNS